MTKIQTLFASDIDRRIEEVIKVDQTDEEIIADEIDEYVATDSLKRHFLDVLERYQETPQKPHEGAAVWISGFFGSGKSSFAKLLGLALDNRSIQDIPAGKRFADRVGDPKLKVVLKTIEEQIPTHTVIFDVSTDRGIRSGNQMLTEIMYGLFLASLGYAKDIDLAELEIALEQEGRLVAFESAFQAHYGKDWNARKGMLAFAKSEASQILHQLDPTTYPVADSWARSHARADVSPRILADRVADLMARRRPGYSLAFVVDEVGQFVARDVQKMLDLQAIVQQLGVKGRGKYWVVVTSQEKLNELVSGLDDKKIELARLMDRFPLQVHLEPSDIAEVTSRRVLSKNGGAETQLGSLYDENRARLEINSQITADVRLPTLTRERFVDLYPLLPYQIDLIIDVVSGLRTQGGASRHVGGANRTIIKLAQQLLINPATRVADEDIGALVRLDQIYDLIDSNIGSDIRGKIASIPSRTRHPLAQATAKVVCLLQFVKTVHRNAENIAACLVDRVDAGSRLAEVKDALSELELGLFVRQGEDGFRIPTPAEDDWDKVRQGIDPRRADERQLFAVAMAEFWTPQPNFLLGDSKVFKAGLMIDGVEKVQGDIAFSVQFADDSQAALADAEAARTRSQSETRTVFWIVPLDEGIRREAREAFRSEEMMKRQGRDTSTADELKLVAEERTRLRTHQQELRRRLKAAGLTGRIYFRGNDRSPGAGATEIGKVAGDVLGRALPLVYDRFAEASAKKQDVIRGIDALLTATDLNGLPVIFATLLLLRDEGGKPVFRTGSGPLSEILGKIEASTKYGEQATGKVVEEQFDQPPFGWDFDTIRLLTLSLLRAGLIEAAHKGQTIDVATSVGAKECFANNPAFRLASFRPKKGVDFAVVAEAFTNFRETFGYEIKEMVEPAVAAEIKARVEREEEPLTAALLAVRSLRLPGVDMLASALDEMRNIRSGGDDNAILAFNAAHKSIKEAIKRAADLTKALNEPGVEQIERARVALRRLHLLAGEPDLPPGLQGVGETLDDLLSRETFFRELPSITNAADAIEAEYDARHAAALRSRSDVYDAALKTLAATAGWEQLDEGQQHELAAPLEACAGGDGKSELIGQLRSDADACAWRLEKAIGQVRQIIDGDRLATVSAGQYFSGGVETEEQLDQALGGLREELSRLIGEGKKVVVT